ncbi:unnamed protein product, partial [Polarella glacialis]
FGILFYQAIEASRDGSPLVTDDLVTQLCRVTKVSLKSQLALSVAWLQAPHEVTRLEGGKFLRTKLREFLSPSGRGQRLSEPLLHALLSALRGQELKEALDDKDRHALSKQLIELYPDFDTSSSPVAGLVDLQRM